MRVISVKPPGLSSKLLKLVEGDTGCAASEFGRLSEIKANTAGCPISRGKTHFLGCSAIAVACCLAHNADDLLRRAKAANVFFF